MTREQAAEIVTLIKAATRGHVDQSKESYFQAALDHLDYDTALAAANAGTVTWRVFPSWAEFKEVYRAQDRLREPVGEQREKMEAPPDDPAKRGVAAPEWVWVWNWCRTMREPRNLIPFPQEYQNVDPSTVMSQEDYEKLRQEWIAAGSPKAKDPLPSLR